MNTKTGKWQTDLRFYSNFHPDRVTADEKRVPRADVMRAVVGSRAGESDMGSGMDWGIARLGNWKDAQGLDLTPLALYPDVPAAGLSLVSPAYTRHHFPFDDNDAVTWDNMERDTTHCASVGESAPGKKDGGMWAIRMRTAPIHDGVKRDRVGCNSRWGAGMIHANCALKDVKDNILVHNCNSIGGSSGSPILHKDAKGNWHVVGVQHGGGVTDFGLLAPVCTEDTPANSNNNGPSVERFRYAPRFAVNVAVHRRPDNPAATAVFVIDGDANRVVYRTRAGSAPSYDSEFGFWRNLGSPIVVLAPPARLTTLTRIAACSADAKARPQIFVAAGRKMYTRSAGAGGAWSLWSSFDLPGAASNVLDIDASADADGRCRLFMVAKEGAFTRAKTSDTAWGAWSKVATGAFNRITTLRYDGVVWAALLDTAGDIWKTSLGKTGWTFPAKLPRAAEITGWRDIDMTWDEHGRGFLLAIPKSGGGNRLRFLPMYGDKAWADWRFFDTHLWAPGADPQDAPNLQTITASHWMEDKAGTTSPVIFATDDAGNIYFIEYARVGTPGWVLDWKSFYHERIVYK